MKTQTSNNQINNTLKSDLFKLSKYKSIWISIIILSVITILLFAVTLFTSKTMDEMLSIEGEDFSYSFNGKDLLFSSFNLDCSMVQILCAIIICIFVGNEFQSGMIRIYISRGINRLNLYLSKLISLIILSTFYCIFSLVLSGIFSGIYGYGIEFNSYEFGILMRSFSLQLLAIISFESICLMFVFLFRSTGTSIGAGIGIYIGFDLVISIVIALLNVSEVNTEWIQFLPLQQQSIASTIDELTITNIIAATLMPIIYSLASSLFGIFSFIKRDIK